MRYLPHTPADITAMLETIGVDSIDDLFTGVPAGCRTDRSLDLPEALDEWALKREVGALASLNATPSDTAIYLGAGCYDHFVPQTVVSLMGRSEFVTAYTPYQPEVSQGTLQAIYEYQTLVCRLLGMDVANASLYDGASALAEGLLMSIRVTRRNRVALSMAIHPHYRAVAKTYLAPGGYEVVELPVRDDGTTDLDALESPEMVAAVALQSPNVFGCIEALDELAAFCANHGALSIAAFTEPLAYGLLKSPGSQGIDIACGEGRSFGLGMAVGGMSLGMFAAKQEYIRQMPGRLVGQTTDTEGRRGFVLTLATREQHIRRERATSNICSNQSLCALGAAQYLACLGKTGIRELAQQNFNKAAYLKQGLADLGCVILFARSTFNEFVVRFPAGMTPPYDRMRKTGIVPGLPLGQWYPEYADAWLVCVTETKSRDDLDRYIEEVRACMIG